MTVTDYLRRHYQVHASARSPVTLPIGRGDLPAMTAALGFTAGAEIGVWKGEFSARLCEGNPRLRMLCVDPWISYPAWRDTKNTLTDQEAAAFMEAAYHAANERLMSANAMIIREFSTVAAESVPNASLDFVYIDGNHGKDAVLEDLAAWTPKIRPGGFISGHDYREQAKKPFIQVMAAVKQWTSNQGIAPWFVLGRDRSPSFLWEVA